ncbi:MAG: hypothetical protein ACK5NY_03705 [Burkholderiaceae bacterium]|jgi:hypothetical protein
MSKSQPTASATTSQAVYRKSGGRPNRAALDWLATNADSGAIVERARQLLQLQCDIDGWSNSRHLRVTVTSLDQHRLSIIAAHSAMLAKVRQHLPSLLSMLQQKGWSIEKIDSKAKMNRETAETKRTAVKTGYFSATAQHEWLALCEQLTDPALREATRRLCERSGWLSAKK